MMKKAVFFLIRFYRKNISPYKSYTRCKYFPTCSEYAIEAVEKYGVFKGSYLGIKRILRCHPWSEGGYDPVP